MKLQDFIIGVGLFALFTLVIFGSINPNNPHSIYGANYLNTTVDSNTTESIEAFSAVGENASTDFGLVGGDVEDFTTDRDRGEVATEGNLLNEGVKILLAIPRFFGTATHAMGEIGSAIGVPQLFQDWIAVSIVVIIVLLIATAFLRNKLQS